MNRWTHRHRLPQPWKYRNATQYMKSFIAKRYKCCMSKNKCTTQIKLSTCILRNVSNPQSILSKSRATEKNPIIWGMKTGHYQKAFYCNIPQKTWSRDTIMSNTIVYWFWFTQKKLFYSLFKLKRFVSGEADFIR